MSTDNKTLADAQPGGRVRLGDQNDALAASLRQIADAQYTRRQRFNGRLPADVQEVIRMAADALTEKPQYITDAYELGMRDGQALSAQPSPSGEGALLREVCEQLESLDCGACIGSYAPMEDLHGRIAAHLAARQPVGEPVAWLIDWPGEPDLGHYFAEEPVHGGRSRPLYAAPHTQAVDLGPTFQDGVSEWMGQCFLPSLYSDMTERGDRLLEEVLELLQAHGYDSARVPTLVDYVFGRPVGEPAQEVGGVMVTLAGYCWVAGLDMHAAGDAELARISQPEVMAKIRAKQEAKNALHFDTPLPGNAGPTAQAAGEPAAWVHEEDPARVISARQKATALRDQGASGSSVRPYSVPAYLQAPTAQDVDLGELRRLSDGWLARSDRLSVTQQRKAGAYWACAKELRDWLDSQAVGK
ncbi:hypothetical protein ACNJRW_09480 [Stenotrophomonas maltophilia]